MERIRMFDLLRRIEVRTQFEHHHHESFKARMNWINKYQEDCTVLVFHNTGKHLFVQEGIHSADSLYYLPWKWVKYAEFEEEKFVQISGSLHKGFKRANMFRLKHCGHLPDGVVSFNISNGTCPKRKRKINLCKNGVYYVAIKEGNIVSTCRRRLSLPIRLFRLYALILKPSKFKAR